MGYKRHLSDIGFMYSDKKGAWIKGKGWGRYTQVAMLMKGLFEIRQDDKVVFSHFIESFDKFKKIINEYS